MTDITRARPGRQTADDNGALWLKRGKKSDKQRPEHRSQMFGSHVPCSYSAGSTARALKDVAALTARPQPHVDSGDDVPRLAATLPAAMLAAIVTLVLALVVVVAVLMARARFPQVTHGVQSRLAEAPLVLTEGRVNVRGTVLSSELRGLARSRVGDDDVLFEGDFGSAITFATLHIERGAKLLQDVPLTIRGSLLIDDQGRDETAASLVR